MHLTPELEAPGSNPREHELGATVSVTSASRKLIVVGDRGQVPQRQEPDWQGVGSDCKSVACPMHSAQRLRYQAGVG